MTGQGRGHGNSGWLWTLIGAAGAYGGWEYLLPPRTAGSTVDAVVGVLLGLYICSHPAANGIDLIFAQRGAIQRMTSEWSGMRWLALNFLVMLIGWMVLVVGVSRLMGRVE
jgi:D-alanyl-lipoteichoic acid acyltransferase DltB (MBOAT superfamily)